MTKSEKIILFEPQIEKFFIYLPIIFMALIPFEFLFFKDSALLQNRLFSEIILNSIFLNVTHIALTYIMLFFFPEMRQWIIQRSGGKASKFWIKNVLIFLSLFIFFFIPYLHTPKNWLFLIFILLSAQAPFHHAIYQIRGLSACYSQAILATGLTEPQTKKFRLSEVMEKYFFHLFFGVSLLFRLSFHTQQEPDFLVKIFAVLNFSYLQVFYFSSVTLLFIFLVFILKNLPKSTQSNKGLYLIRLLAFPLGQFSAMAAWASVLIHGTEYFCLYLKMCNRSHYANKKRVVLVALITLLLFGLFYSLLRVWRYSFDPQSSDLPMTLIVLSTIVTSLNFLHYYLDRILFRMRDPVTRENISPLII